MSETNPSEDAPPEEPTGEEVGGLSDTEPLPGQDVFADEDMADAQAHCPHCLEPITPADYYCPGCAKPVGQLTGYLPLISVPFEVQFLAGMWRTIWSANAHWGMRVLCAVIIVAIAPFMVIIGLPVVLWRQISDDLKRRRERRK